MYVGFYNLNRLPTHSFLLPRELQHRIESVKLILLSMIKSLCLTWISCIAAAAAL
jgi:hypothetical protein